MNNYLKSMLIIVVSMMTIINAKEMNQADRPLKNKALAMVDGMREAMDGTTVAKLIHILKEIEVMLYGERGLNNERVGRYVFDSAKYSIHGLARMARSKTIKNNPAKMEELNQLLKTIKTEFIQIMMQFIEQARFAKSITIVLMEEWAENRNRADSFLLTWEKQPEESEFESFDQEINSFSKLQQFCKDLISFIDDMINSCPRGWQQYCQLKNKYSKE